jgi:NitT/TauT family transport system substrate-binding protein
MGITRKAFALGAIVAFVVGACSSSPAASTGASGSAAPGGALTKIRFQLQWVAQAQFAGYYAAIDQGYYRDQGLDVQVLLGGPDINPMQVVAADGAEIGTTWVPKMLASREGGTDLVDIAQIFQRSGTLEVSFKDKNIATVAAMKGKKVGSWLGGNEPEVFAALTKAGIDPAKDVTVIKQDFNMAGLLTGDLDVAQAMIYNEYAQVLEAKNPKTGALYKPEDLNVIDFNGDNIATAMLQDMIFARDSWLKKAGNEDIAVKFLVASYKGWIFCRDNASKCVDIVLKAGSKLGASHQAWQMNEINSLIWPSATGIGLLDKGDWAQTVSIATKYGILKKEPDDAAFRTDLAKKALDALGDKSDVRGAGFAKATVELKEGGN